MVELKTEMLVSQAKILLYNIWASLKHSDLNEDTKYLFLYFADDLYHMGWEIG